MSLENDILQAIRGSIADSIKAKLTGYNSPLDSLIASVVESHRAELNSLFDDAFSATIRSDEFRKHICDGVHSHLAKQLVQKFGGEIEKQVNALKADPTSRAKITLAIEGVVKELSNKQ